MSEYPTATNGWRASVAGAVKSSRGASLVEYALLVGLIAVVCVGAIAYLGRVTEPAFSEMGDGFQNQNQN